MAVQVFTDMMGREVALNHPPKRIISLVPSQTELLFDLGLNDEVVGITKFCVHPEQWFRTKQRIGGTKNVNFDTIAQLQPDLIIANKEENTREQVEALAEKYPVWISDIKNIADGIQMIQEIGKLTGRVVQANTITEAINNGFAGFHRTITSKKVAYFIWRSPWMCAGGDTFISNVIETIGWQNVLADKNRYPEIELQELTALQPDLILLSSEPYPFKEKHAKEIKEIVPCAVVKLVDGEMFSWYGSRMVKAIPYLQSLIS